MPCYEYRCTACGATWERIESIGEHDRHGPETECPECHRQTAERVIGPVTAILRGDGWAHDGYSPSSLSDDDLK
jgi:putative FmdB family regulatory protein